MVEAQTNFLLVQMVEGSSSAKRTAQAAGLVNEDAKVQKTEDKGKGKGANAKAKAKAKGKAKGASAKARVRMPLELKDMASALEDGTALCFGFNMKTGCPSKKPAVDTCDKGYHGCCKPKCGKPHSMQQH